MILDVKALISIIKYDINIKGAPFGTVIRSVQFRHLIPSAVLLLGIISRIVLLHFWGEGGANDCARTLKLTSSAHF